MIKKSKLAVVLQLSLYHCLLLFVVLFAIFIHPGVVLLTTFPLVS